MEASLWFYRDLLGMEVAWRGPVGSTHGEVATLRSPGGGQTLELNHYPSDGPMGPPYREGDEIDHLAFGVEDVFRAVDELRARGVPVKVEPRGGGQLLCAFVLDPNGIWVELLPTAPGKSGSTSGGSSDPK